MRALVELCIHFICTLFTLLKPGGVKSLMAENLALKQQLVVISRCRCRAPKLETSGRFFFAFIHFLIGDQRIRKIAVILQPATILRFHKALVKRKYSLLYSNKTKKKAGRKGPEQAIVDLIIEMKVKNPQIGYGRIAMQIYQTFAIHTSRYTVGRIIRQHFRDKPGNCSGPKRVSGVPTSHPFIERIIRTTRT